MIGVIALSRRIAYPGNFDVFSGCLAGPNLAQLGRQFRTMFRSTRLNA
jgi:hypothetical protein